MQGTGGGAGARVSQRGFNEREEGRGGEGRRKQKAWESQSQSCSDSVNLSGMTSKEPHLNHRYFEDAGMKGLGRHNYLRCHSLGACRSPSYCLQ